MNNQQKDLGNIYLIENEKGYWLPDGLGYTKNKEDAGRFSIDDMAKYNLNACTLTLHREVKPRGPGKFLGD